MEGITKAPTDNLYKFMAIAGVAIILGAVYLLVNVMRETQSAHQAYNSTASAWLYEGQTVQVSFERLDRSYDEFLKKLSTSDGSSVDTSELETELQPSKWLPKPPKNNELETLQEHFRSANGYVAASAALQKTIGHLEDVLRRKGTDAIHDDINLLLSQCHRVSSELSVAVQKWESVRSHFPVLKAKADWLKAGTQVTALLCIVGSAVAFFGFTLWYRRVQVPLDKILRKDAGAEENAPLITIFADGHHECLDTAALTVEQRDFLHQLAGSFSVGLDEADAAQTQARDESYTGTETTSPACE